MIAPESALTNFRPDWLRSANDASMFPIRRAAVKVRISSAKETPRWLPYVVGRMGDLERLLYEPADEVPTPCRAALERALLELRRFMAIESPTPSVVPTFDGGVQFVWHKGGWDIEVEVGEKETMVWARRRDGGDSWGGSLDDRVGDVRKLLSELAKLI